MPEGMQLGIKNIKGKRSTAAAEKVKDHLKEIVQGEIIRYELPNISYLFVIMLCLMDTNVKSNSYALLQMEIRFTGFYIAICSTAIKLLLRLPAGKGRLHSCTFSNSIHQFNCHD